MCLCGFIFFGTSEVPTSGCLFLSLDWEVFSHYFWVKLSAPFSLSSTSGTSEIKIFIFLMAFYKFHIFPLFFFLFVPPVTWIPLTKSFIKRNVFLLRVKSVLGSLNKMLTSASLSYIFVKLAVLLSKSASLKNGPTRTWI